MTHHFRPLHYRFSLLLSLFCSWSWCGAQEALQFEHFSVKDGLTQATVRCIHQDRLGFLWLGTEEGLNRFDGYEFRPFHNQVDDPSSLSHDNITVIMEDGDGDLWFGTYGGGLNLFDRKTQSFKRYLPGTIISAIIQDTDGMIWLSAVPTGLQKLDKSSNRFLPVALQMPPDTDRLGAAYPFHINEDSQGLMWICVYNGGLQVIDKEGNMLRTYRSKPNDATSLSSDRTWFTHEDRSGSIWIGTHDGLNRFDPKSDSFTRFLNSSQPGSLSHDDVRTCLEDSKGQLWFGTMGGGLNRFDRKTGLFLRQSNDPMDPTSLSSGRVWIIKEDKSGGIWVGTETGGLNKYAPYKNKFPSYRKNPEDSNSLNDNTILSFCEDARKNLWIGTKGGLNYLDRKQNLYRHYTREEGNPDSLGNNAVNALHVAAGQVWIGTWGDGLNRLDVASGKIRHYPYSGPPGTASGSRIRAILPAEDGGLFLGTFNSGLYHFDPVSEKFVHFPHNPNDKNSLSHRRVWAMAQDKGGVLWVATHFGLNRFNPKTRHFEHFYHEAERANSLSTSEVISVAMTRSGQLWVGTTKGLNRMDGNGIFTRYFKSDGLENEVINGILEARDGHLWLSTNRGLSELDPERGDIRNYDVYDGLQGYQFQKCATYRGADGELFFGGNEGFNAFYPADIPRNTLAPNVVITEFKIFDVPVEPGEGSPLKFHIGQTKEIKLTHNDRGISFEFAALNLRDPKRNLYRYRLENFDKDWNRRNSDSRFALYTILPAGSYTFRVTAANDDELWNETGATVKLTVLPAPWRSLGAIVIYVLVVLGLIYLILWVQRRELVHERHVVERLKRVDRMKDEFFANTSHELRTPLNGMIGLAESLMEGVTGPLPEEAVKHLGMIASSGKRLAGLVNDILDFSKLKGPGLEIRLHAVDIHALTELVLAIIKPLIGKKDLTLWNSVEEGVPQVWGDENRIQQILHNLIGNAVKFTDSGCIEVSARKEGAFLIISLADTGIGIAKDHQKRIFQSFEQGDGSAAREYGGTGLGLAISRQLIELQGGRIWLTSVPGEGSTFFFSLPLAGERVAAPNQRALEAAPLLMLEEEVADVPQNNEDEVDEPGRVRILIVDDEPINRQVLLNHLRMENNRIIQAVDGFEALEILERSPNFDIVLLDVMMPRMTGYEVCRKLRERFSLCELPVIFLTARNQTDDLVACFLAGGNDYLVKPTSSRELLHRVNMQLSLVRTTRELVAKNEEIRLKERQKIEALKTLTAGIAHEINNAANANRGGLVNMTLGLEDFRRYLFELAGEDADPEILESFRSRLAPILELADSARSAIDRITGVVAELYRFSRLNQAEDKRVPLVENLDAAVFLVLPNYADTVTFRSDYADPLEMMCRPAELSLAFFHLIVNACEAITVVAERSGEAGLLTISTRLQGERALITFCDTGRGMNEAVRARVFEPFFTTKPVGAGTGLGLSTCYGIIEQHHGHIEVASIEGEGSTFSVTLPMGGNTEA